MPTTPAPRPDPVDEARPQAAQAATSQCAGGEVTSTASLLEGQRSAQHGFIVVTALWLLAALAALASVASVYVAQSAVALAAFDTATQLEMLTTAGLELAAYELSAPVTVRRPTHGGFSFGLANSRVTVEYMSENARINLNMASRTYDRRLVRGARRAGRGGRSVCRSGGRMAEHTETERAGRGGCTLSRRRIELLAAPGAFQQCR